VTIKPGTIAKINGSGDLAMSHKKWINKDAIVIKQCKSGLFLVQDIMSNDQTTVPKRNLDIIEEAWSENNDS
jgi:hypothetical protein